MRGALPTTRRAMLVSSGDFAGRTHRASGELMSKRATSVGPARETTSGGRPVQPEPGPVVYLTLTMRLSEEAGDTPMIDVIRAVRDAAVALAASRGAEPDPDEVIVVARRRLGIAG